MDSGSSDLERASGAAADLDIEASAGAGNGKIKNGASSQVLILGGDEGPQAAVTETASALTGEKKTGIKSKPTFGDHSCCKIVVGKQEQEQEREEIEGLDWDDDRLAKEIDGCLRRLKDAPLIDNDWDNYDESFYLDEEQLRVLNRRLALCRIRAHEEKYTDMDDKTLSELFPPSKLEAMGYYKYYEVDSEWHFDPAYCHYAHLQDYQRLMLQNNGLYEDWEFYRRICSTLESDRDFVRFWEELASKTELIECYMTRLTRREPRIESLFYYHALKVAVGYPHVYRILIEHGFIEFRHRVQIEFTWHREYADFLFQLWKLLTERKMSFEDALRRVYNNDKYSFVFFSHNFEKNLSTVEEVYKPILDRAVEKINEADVKGLIMDFVKGGEGRKTYYDYAKNKLRIAKKIGLIP